MSTSQIDYRIISAESPHELERKVQEFTAKGWRPLGAPFTSSFASGHGHVISLPDPPEGQIGDAIQLEFHQALTFVDVT